MPETHNNERRHILPRSRILRGREPIQRLFQKGKLFRGTCIDLRYLIFPDQPGMCLMGFIAGKRLGKAHERNLIKRRMRESFRHHQYVVRDIAQSRQVGFQGIFIAKKSGVSYQAVDKDCSELLHHVRRYIQKQGTS